MGFRDKYPVRTKVAVHNKVLEQDSNSSYVDCDVTFETCRAIELNSSPTYVAQNKTRKEARMMAVLLYGNETWISSRRGYIGAEITYAYLKSVKRVYKARPTS